MIRVLLIVLLLALPTQFVWAVAAGYCAHESNPASFHMGHHSHEHHASSPDAHESPDADADTGDASRGTATQFHTDCSYCHAVAAQFASTHPSSSGSPPRHVFDASGTASLGVGPAQNIERPKWTRAARPGAPVLHSETIRS